MTGTVYAIRDGEDGAIRYVGATTWDIEQRFTQHRIDARNGSSTPFHVWLRSADDARCVALERLISPMMLGVREQIWIDQMRREGADLLNARDAKMTDPVRVSLILPADIIERLHEQRGERTLSQYLRTIIMQSVCEG